MSQFFVMFAGFWRSILTLFSSVTFSVVVYEKTINISLSMILFTGLVFSIIIGVFWKGARA